MVYFPLNNTEPKLQVKLLPLPVALTLLTDSWYRQLVSDMDDQ